MPASLPVSPRNPLRTYQFRVGIVEVPGGGAEIPYVAGVRSVSGLRAQVSAYETWEGGNNLHRYANPNKVSWEPITLEQGLALDNTLELWSEAVLEFVMSGIPPTGKYPQAQPAAPGAPPPRRAVKRQVIIDVWDENEFPTAPPTPAPPAPAAVSQVAPRSPLDRNRCRRYRIHNAWISRYQALPKLDSMSSEVALLSVELMHEGWVRETF
jgi:phage tail-like protein